MEGLSLEIHTLYLNQLTFLNISCNKFHEILSNGCGDICILKIRKNDSRTMPPSDPFTNGVSLTFHNEYLLC